MNLLEAREIVLAECGREKRIVMRNTVGIAVLIMLILVVAYMYALPQILTYLSSTNSDDSSNPYSAYYKWTVLLMIVVAILYPIISFYKVIYRGKKVLTAFDKIEKGTAYRILTEETKYLTTIPLYWIKLKYSPVHYVSLAIDNKQYALPVPEIVAVKLKTALSGADLGKISSINNQLFGNVESKDDSANQPSAVYPTLEAFQQFTITELQEDIKAMEGSRKRTKSMTIIQFILAIVFVGTMFYVSIFNPDALSNSASLFALIGVVFGGSIILTVLYMVFTKRKGSGSRSGDYTEFKKSIFSRMVKYVNPSFEYVVNGHIEHSHLAHSGLFVDKAYKITGGDQIVGNHAGIPFQSCNLSVSYRPSLRNEKEADDVVFAGNYFVARFNKRFQSPIYIHPKKGVFGRRIDNGIANYLNTCMHQIRLEDPDFEKQFTVYCADEIIARYVLTPAMMERIKEINTRSKGNFYIAINEHNIVLANNSGNTSMNMDGGSSSLFTKIDEHLLTHLFEDLMADLNMIETLKLNINIWNN